MIKYILRSIVLIAVLSFAACKGETSTDSNDKASSDKASTFKVNNPEKISPQANVKAAPNKAQQQPEAKPYNKAAGDPKENAKKAAILASIPSACSMISKVQVSEIFGIPVESITQMNASSISSPYTQSCFYKWDSVEPNSGILVQVQGNPIPDDYAQWVSLYVSSKRSSGENDMSGEVFKYKKLEGLGDDGSYSHRLGKYVWRTGEDYVFTISFRANSEPKKQLSQAKKIGAIVMENYNNQ